MESKDMTNPYGTAWSLCDEVYGAGWRDMFKARQREGWPVQAWNGSGRQWVTFQGACLYDSTSVYRLDPTWKPAPETEDLPTERKSGEMPCVIIAGGFYRLPIIMTHHRFVCFVYADGKTSVLLDRVENGRLVIPVAVRMEKQ